MWHWWLWYGLDATHSQCSGARWCLSRQLLRSELALEGIQVDRMQHFWPWQHHWPTRINKTHLQALLQQWSQLLGAGLPLLSCITLVVLAQVPARLKYELIQLQKALLNGASFSQALAQSRLFPKTMVQLVAAGEASGDLATLLIQMHQQYGRQTDLTRRFKRSLFMPLLTLLSGCGVSVLIVYWVVPQVANLYTTGVNELPILTRWLVNLSHTVELSIGDIVGGCILAYMAVFWLWHIPKAKAPLERVLWSIPGLGRLMYLQSQAEVFLVLSLTFKAGVPLLECLALAASSSNWQHVSNDLNKAIVALHQGQRLSQILTKLAWQPQALQLIRVGESAGNLAVSFTQLQDYYEVQVVSQSEWLEQLLEPILLILVAVFVGLILVALYLPLFQMGQMM